MLCVGDVVRQGISDATVPMLKNLAKRPAGRQRKAEENFSMTGSVMLSRTKNPRRVAWHLLHVQAGNDNYIDLSAHMHASQAQVEGCRTSLEVEYKALSHLWSSD